MKNEPFVIEGTFDAPISAVWKAITDKNDMKQWCFDIAAFQPEVGFEFQFEGGNEENRYLHLCQVTEVVVGKKLSYSWRYDGYEGNTLVIFELIAEGEKTKLKLTHEGLETFPASIPDFEKENFAAGWTQIIGTLLREFVEKDTINKSIEVNAVTMDVWDVLVKPKYTKQWGNEFGEGTYVETNWKEGAEVLWKDREGNIGAKGIVEINDPATLLKVIFYDDVSSKPPAQTGEYAEIYALSEKDGKTIISIEAGPLSVKEVKIHSPLWDKALAKMKALAEE